MRAHKMKVLIVTSLAACAFAAPASLPGAAFCGPARGLQVSERAARVLPLRLNTRQGHSPASCTTMAAKRPRAGDLVVGLGDGLIKASLHAYSRMLLVLPEESRLTISAGT